MDERKARCLHCGKPAVCHGSYEGQPVSYACDECCGHGNEDGWCYSTYAEGIGPPVNQGDEQMTEKLQPRDGWGYARGSQVERCAHVTNGQQCWRPGQQGVEQPFPTAKWIGGWFCGQHAPPARLERSKLQLVGVRGHA